MSLEQSHVDYVEHKSVTLKVRSSLGHPVSNFNITVTYSVKSSEPATVSHKKDDLDLDDEVSAETSDTAHTKTFSNSDSLTLDVSSAVSKPGRYILQVEAEFHSTTTADKNDSFKQSYQFPLVAFSKIKVNHLKMSVTNPQDKSDEKEITVEFPKRNFKNIKATQNSVIKLKVKV